MKKTQLDNAWRKVRALFKAYGFPYKLVDDDPIHCWTGTFGHIIDPTRNYNGISNAIHEFAHWLVSHPNRRNKPDFGLGFCPDSRDYFKADQTMSVSVSFAEKEEECASCLGIIIERTLNLDPQWTVEFHSWEGMDDPKFLSTQTKLRRRGLINSENKFPLKPAA